MEECAQCEVWKNRLLNAFQLIKNGKQTGYLKFDEFVKSMDNQRDYNGKLINEHQLLKKDL